MNGKCQGCRGKITLSILLYGMKRMVPVKTRGKKGHKMAFFKPELIKQNILYVYPALIILLINIIFIVLIVLVIAPKLPPQTPLYYGLPRGEAQLVSPFALILPLALSSLFIALNLTVSYFINNLFIKRMLAFGGFFGFILSIITVVKIIFINI